MTPKQQAFSEHYIACLNATKAAKLAGYSERSAHVSGCKNLAKPHIKAYIDERLGMMQGARIADGEEVLEALTRIMRREEAEDKLVTIKKKTSGYDSEGRKVVREETTPTIVHERVSIKEAFRAAELLGRRYGLFADTKNEAELSDINITVDFGEGGVCGGDGSEE